MVGGAIAFGISQAGLDFSQQPQVSPKARDLGQKTVKKTAEPTPTNAELHDNGATVKPDLTKNSGTKGAPDPTGKGDEEKTEKTLEAIEDAAKETLKVREGAEGEKPISAEGSEPAPTVEGKVLKDKKEKKVEPAVTPDGDGSRPEPRLPDNLAPAPEPPPSQSPTK
jgi:hypothetical protein